MKPSRIIIAGLAFAFSILFALLIKTAIYTIILFPVFSFVITALLQDQKKAMKIGLVLGLAVGIVTGLAQLSWHTNEGDFQSRTGIWVWSPEEDTVNRTMVCEAVIGGTQCTEPLPISSGYFYNMSSTYQTINFVLTVAIITLLFLSGSFVYKNPNLQKRPV